MFAAAVTSAWGSAVSDQVAGGGGIRHVAWLYRTPAEFLAGVREFVRSDEPVLVAVPPEWLAPDVDRVVETVPEVAALSQNPARIMPVLRAFADEHPGQRVRALVQLAWPGRSAAELGEIARYEAMLNVAFARTPISILCPYNEAELPASGISAARASHPSLRGSGREFASADYRVVTDGWGRIAPPLLAPPGATALTYWQDLRPVRALVAAAATEAGLSAPRRTDLVIAASEVAANTLKHTSGAGLMRVWITDDEVLCQLDDGGQISDPLAGYSRPAGDVAGGQGLWLVHQVCDLAEIRTSERGTTIRLHMYRDLARVGASPGRGSITTG
jgi:anti-sigma regulatory factor (Ser/Thr protein kinase)